MKNFTSFFTTAKSKLSNCNTLLVALLLLLGGMVNAQTAANYTMVPTSPGSYTALSGASSTSAADLDDGFVNAIPMGFTFNFAGTGYTYIHASTNGWMTLGTSTSNNALSGTTLATNSLASAASFPTIAPLWDDLSLTTAGGISYISAAGSSPNRITTVQYSAIKWNYQAGGTVVEFQVKFYENGNKIQYIYNAGGTAYNAGSTTGASIGLASATGVYLSLSGSGTSPTTSTSSETSTITAKPATGQTYTFTPPYISVANTDWNTASTWNLNAVPPSGALVFVNTAVTLGAALTNTGNITINSGASLTTTATITNNATFTVAGTLQFNPGGYTNGSTNLTYTGTTNTLVFNNNTLYGVSNVQTFWPSSNSPYNVTVLGSGAQLLSSAGARTIAGTLSLSAQYDNQAGTTVNGTLQINASGYVSNTAPIYGSSSTLKYNTGNTYGRGLEWSASTGTIGVTAGYPNNVQTSTASTVLSYSNSANYGAFTINGSLTIDASTSFYMDFGSPASNGVLTVNGSVTATGNLSLGNTTNGDLVVKGSWTKGAGTFSPNSRTVTFNGASTQTITGATGFYNLTINNTSGGVTTSAANTVSNVLTLTSGIFTSSTSLGITNTAVGAISGGSATSFINGPVTRSLPNTSLVTDNYVFPVGVTAAYFPFAITNPTGTTPVATIQAFATTTGGSADGTTLAAINTTEYWSAALTGTLSAGTVSVAKASIGTSTLIGKSSTLTGSYSSLGGSTNSTLITSNTVTSTTATGSTLGFFVLGNPLIQYYSKASGNLNVLGTWTTDITLAAGTAPPNFTNAGQVFNIRNQATPTIATTAWVVSGTGSRVILGDGTNACNFTVPTGTPSFTGTLDISNNGTLTLQNTTVPTFGTLNAGSTVNYATASGTQTIAATTYGNLTLSGAGTRTFPSGTVGIAGTSATAFSPGSFTSATQGTIDFTSASAQTIPAFTYFNLANSGNGARTLANSGTVGVAGTTFTTGSGAYTVTGSTVNFSNATGLTIPVPTAAATNNYNVLTISGAGSFPLGGSPILGSDYNQSAGTLIISNASVGNTLTVGGNLNITGGAFDLINSSTAPSATVNVSGNLSVSTAITSGTGIFFEPVASTTGAGVMQVNGNATFNGTNGTTTRLIDWGVTGTLTGNQLRIKGNLIVSGTAYFYSSTSNAAGADGIVFNGTGATQQLTYSTTSSSTVYSSWIVNSGAVVQLQTSLAVGTSTVPYSNFTVNGTLDAQTFLVSGGNSTVDAANTGFSLASAGTLITKNTAGVTGTITDLKFSYSNTANYTFNGTSAQTTNFSNLTMNNLTIANTNASGVTVTDTTSPIVNGTLTLTSNPLKFGATTGTLTLNGPITTGTGSIAGAGAAATSVSNLTVGGTGAATLTLAGNFGNFTWSRTTAGTLTTSGTVNIDGSWSNSAGALLDLSTNTTTINLNFAGAQTIGGTNTFFNLTSAASGSKNFGTTTTTIAGTLTIASGTMDTTGAGNTFIFNGATGSMLGAGTKAFNNLTINSGAITNPSGGNITISGNYVNNGTSFIQASTLTTTFGGTAQSLTGTGATTFGNVTVQGTSTLSAGTHNVGVTGTFSVSSGGTFNGGTATVAFSGTTTMGVGTGTYNFNNFTISSGTLSNATNNKNFNVSGTWTNNGTYTAGSETISFTGTSPQTVGGSASTTFNNVTVSGTAGGLSLGNSQNINGNLVLSAASGGNIDLNGSNNITLGSTTTITGETCSRQFINGGSPTQGNGYVQTTRNFVSGTNYLGITITSGTAMGSTNIKRFVQKAVSSVGSANSVKRIYSITPTNAATGNVTLVSSYCDGELNSNTESAPTLITYYSTGANETTGANYSGFYATASNDTTANTVTTPATGSLIAGQNNITLANPGGASYYTVQNGDWNTGATWALGVVPVAAVATNIKHAVTINAAVTNAPNSITIDASKSLTFGSSGAITTTTLTNSGTVDMTSGGTLTIANGGAIANGSATFTGGTGTVATLGTATLSGTTISLYNFTLNGTLTNSATTTNIFSTLRLNQGSSISGNALVYDSGAASTVSYSGTSTQTATSLDFPSSNGPTNVVVNNAGGFRLPFSRTVSGNFTVTSGDVQNLSGTAVNLTMTGTAANLVVNGSITGTNVGAGNDINLIYNTAGILSVSGSGSLSRFLNATVGSSSTLAISRVFEVMYGAFAVNGALRIDTGGAVSSVVNAVAPIYGASSSLVYNSGTTYNRFFEWSASGVGTIGTTAGYPNNVTVQNGTTLNLSNSDNTNRALNGNLTLGSGTTSNGSLNMEAMTGKLTVAGNVLIGGNSASGTSTLTLSTNASSAAIEVGGNWTRTSTGVFTDNGRGTFFIGSGTSTITTNTTAQFTYLLINKTSGGTVSLANDVQVNSTLTLNAQLVTNAFKVIIPTGNGVTANANGWVRGNLQKNIPTGTNSRTFEIGDSSNYTPVTTAYSGVATAGNILVSTTVSDHPQIATSVIDATRSVNRYYSIANSGVAGGTYSPTFTFVAGDLDSGTLTSTLGISNYDNPTWTPLTIGTRTSTSTQATGVTVYGDFQLGEVRTTWNAGAGTTAWTTAGNWSNGVPSTTSNVYIGTAGFYPEIASVVTVNSLTINSGTSIKVKSNYNLTVTDAIVNNGTITLENDGYLLQVNNVANSGTGVTTVYRDSSPIMRLDYTLWSSPVTGQGLYAFSPYTFSNRFYQYLEGSDLYNGTLGFTINPLSLNSDGVNGVDSSNVQFDTAKGYLIRVRWDHPTAPAVWHGQFTGVLPNNGTKPFTLANSFHGYNAVGNPYPSPISISTFLQDNHTNNNYVDSTLWFWRKTNDTNNLTSYVTYSGGTYSTGPQTNYNIQPGQGFIVKAATAGTFPLFKNTQRVATNGHFFRSNAEATTAGEGRIWLNLKKDALDAGSIAIGYKEGATNDLDDEFDGKYINDSPLALTSFVQGQELAVQHRAAPFSNNDVVPLSFKTDVAGTYSIVFNAADGLLDTQDVYLEDLLSGQSVLIKTTPYTFTSAVGNFPDRFRIVYLNPLGVHTSTFTENQVVVYKNEVNDFVINSGNVMMASVKVFDIRGRLLAEKKGINASQINMNVGSANQVLLIQITSIDGEKVTKKVIR